MKTSWQNEKLLIFYKLLTFKEIPHTFVYMFSKFNVSININSFFNYLYNDRVTVNMRCPHQRDEEESHESPRWDSLMIWTENYMAFTMLFGTSLVIISTWRRLLIGRWIGEMGKFPPFRCIFTHLQQMTLENIVAKGEIAQKRQCLLLSQCFQLYSVIIPSFIDTFHIDAFWQISSSTLENIVAKGEIAQSKQCLLLPQSFQLDTVIIPSFIETFHILY